MNINHYVSIAQPRLIRTATVIVAAASSVILTVNGLRLSQIIPDVIPLKLLAPFGAGFAVLALAGILCFLHATTGHRAAVIGVTGLGAVLGTVGLTIVEVVLHYVLSWIEPEARASLLQGYLGTFFAAASMLFLACMVAFCAALAAGRSAPWPPVLMLTLGALLIGLRTLLPIWCASLGVISLGVGILLLAITTTKPRNGNI